MGALSSWVKIELQELFITAIILAVVGAAFIASNGVAQTLSGSSSYQALAMNYLDSSISDMSDFSIALAQANLYVSKASQFSYSASIGGFFIVPFTSSAPRSGLAPLNIAMMNAIDALNNAVLVQVVIKIMFVFFQAIVPAWLFPLGILLRLIPPTRRIGSTLIAFSIGLFMIFPFSIVLAGQAYDILRPGFHTTIDGHFGIKDIQHPPLAYLMCSEWMQFYTVLGEPGWIFILCAWMLLIPIVGSGMYAVCATIINIVYKLSIPLFQIGFTPLMNGYANSLPVDQTFNALYSVALPGVVERVVTTLVLSLVIAIITISITRSISSALGGEAQFYGLSKII